MLNSLPVEFEQFVQRELSSGRYQSEEELVCAALRLLEEHQRRLEALRREIQPALEQLDRGEGKPLDIEQIKADVRATLAQESRNA